MDILWNEIICCCSGVCFIHDRWRWWVYNKFESFLNKIYFITYIRHNYFCWPFLSGAPICAAITLIEKCSAILVFWRFFLHAVPSCAHFPCLQKYFVEKSVNSSWIALIWFLLLPGEWEDYGCCSCYFGSSSSLVGLHLNHQLLHLLHYCYNLRDDIGCSNDM